MLKRLSILFIMLMMATASYQQTPLNFTFSSDETPTPGQTYDVDVRVSDFDNLLSNQYFIFWDSLVLEIDTLSFVTMDIPEYAASMSIPSQTQSMTKGMVNVAWFTGDGLPKSLPDDHLLFTMRFNVVGSDCDSTAITLGATNELEVEILDENLNNVGANAMPFPVAIPGTDCDGGGTGMMDGVGLIFGDETVSPGGSICIPMTVENFDTIETFQGSVMWDPSVITYTGVQNFGLPGLTQGLFGTGDVSNGVITFLWFDQTGVTPQTLPDGSIIFELCFDAVGNLGESSVVTAFDGPTNIQASSPQPIGLRETFVEEGSITIAQDMGDLFGLEANSTSGAPNGNVCIDITSNNFTNISAIQLNMQWDSTILSYTGVENLNTDLQIFANFFNQTATNELVFSWSSPSTQGIDQPDGTLIYSVCFDIIGDCDETAFFNFVDSGVPIEIIDGNTNSIPFNMIDGEISVACGLECESSTVTQPRCQGDSNGAISVNIAGGVAPYSCEWKKDGVTVSIGDANGNTCLIAGQSAGSFVLCVTDANGDSTTCEFELDDPTPPSAAVTVTPANCPAEDGVISIITLGGTGTIAITWSPEIEDLNAVAAGTYDYVLEDFNGCTNSGTVEVPCAGGGVQVEVTNATECDPCGRLDVMCDNDGTISIDPPVLDLTCVPAGTYTITCTDSNNNSSEETVTVGTDPAPAIDVSDIQTTDAVCNGPLGTVTYNITGGCGELTIQAGLLNTMVLDNVENIASYAAGNWGVLVTDENGTTATANFTIGVQGSEPLEVTIDQINDADCDANGSVEFTIDGGCNPEATVTGPSGEIDPTDLPPGDYTLEVTDDVGSIQSTDFTVEDDPNTLPLEVTVSNVEPAPCAEDAGSANINATGGCDPVECVSLTRNGSEVGCSAMLTPGDYVVTYEDNRGNTATAVFTIDGPDPIVITEDSNINGTLNISVEGGDGNYSYMWTFPDGATTSNDEDLTGLTQGGTYALVVMDGNGCSESQNFIVIIEGSLTPIVSVVSDFDGFGTPCAATSIPCEGEGIIDGSITGGTGPYTITLDDGENQTEYSELPITGICAGTYTLIVEDADGIMSQVPNIQVTSPEPISITEDEVDCADAGSANGAIFTMVEGGVGGYIYEWSPNGPDGPDNPNVNVGMYILEVTDDNGCTAEMLFEVRDCAAPGTPCFQGISVITPNNDNINDAFIITCVSDNPNTLRVFDRWGRTVYEDTNYSNDWEGLDLDGEALPEGAYYWVLEVLFDNGDNRVMKGTVTLLRND